MSKIPKLEYYFPELQSCIQDIEMLKDGRWEPDEDSCNATIENLEIIKSKILQFTKDHCKAALKAASKKAYVEYTDLTDGEKFDYTDVITDDDVAADVNKESILTAYPLNKIK